MSNKRASVSDERAFMSKKKLSWETLFFVSIFFFAKNNRNKKFRYVPTYNL